MNKLTFSSYYSLPGIISDRLFSVFDTSNNGYLNANELITGMKTLFCGSYESSSKFIFDFYDFDKDSYITREDIRTVLSYVTLSGISTNTIESQGYLARVHSQEELHALLENSFEGIKENKINYKQFLNIIENKASDIYIFILLFLLDKKPFTKAGINEYEKQINKGVKSPTRKRERQNSTYLASPSTVNNSSFSPSLIFIRESKKRRTVEINPNDIDKAKLLNGGKRDRGKRFTVKSGTSVSLFLKQKMQENNQEKNSEPEIMETNASIVPVHRKTKTNLKNLQSQNSHKEEDSNNMKYNDLKLLPAYKQTAVMRALLSAHPYEEPAFDFYPLSNSWSQAGSGVVGELPDAEDELSFLERVKHILKVGCVKYSKLTGRPIREVALCGGSGAFLIKEAIAYGADVLITGEAKYNDFYDVEDHILLAVVGHYESEVCTKDIFYNVISKKFPTFAVHFSNVNQNPVNYL